MLFYSTVCGRLSFCLPCVDLRELRSIISPFFGFRLIVLGISFRMMHQAQLLAFRALNRFVPQTYEKRLSNWARNVALPGPVLVLSFDCDTDRDAEAAVSVQKYLSKFGLTALYAVPGELLEAHWKDYSKLIELGARFVNHGYRRHADVNVETGKPFSTFTYCNVSDDVWMEDILLGHDVLTRLTGVAPKVFRTPHFGEFNKRKQLLKMYRLLTSLGYRVSSSTKPEFAMVNGSFYNCGEGLMELPLSGCLGKPSQLIDSWGFLSAPDALGKDVLIKELERYVSLFETGKPIVLNLYFDPADIVNELDVLAVLSCFSPDSCRALDDEPLLSLVHNAR